jgi:hypothetical protein
MDPETCSDDDSQDNLLDKIGAVLEDQPIDVTLPALGVALLAVVTAEAESPSDTIDKLSAYLRREVRRFQRMARIAPPLKERLVRSLQLILLFPAWLAEMLFGYTADALLAACTDDPPPSMMRLVNMANAIRAWRFMFDDIEMRAAGLHHDRRDLV